VRIYAKSRARSTESRPTAVYHAVSSTARSSIPRDDAVVNSCVTRRPTFEPLSRTSASLPSASGPAAARGPIYAGTKRPDAAAPHVPPKMSHDAAVGRHDGRQIADRRGRNFPPPFLPGPDFFRCDAFVSKSTVLDIECSEMQRGLSVSRRLRS